MNQFGDSTPFEPRWPTLSALALLSVWVGLLALPMLTGEFVAASYNDQYATGYAFREWAANYWKTLGHVPLWNPEILGGLPFVAGMHGDVFYPTAFLRLILPTHVAMNLGFVVHYVLLGMFTYWFLRLHKVSWAGAVTGAVAYQLSGVIGSYVSPGHDGKLFVTTLLPLALLALTLAIRDKRAEGYALLALTVGLMLLSPHPQMVQYALLAAGIFAVYLTVEHRRESSLVMRAAPLVIALGAVLVGVLIAAIQYFPFYAYIPYSPRDEAQVASLAWSATYGIPWQHTPEFVLSRFVGESFNGTYWATNGVKFHSEYLGLAALALAVLGALDKNRHRLALWLAGIGALFLLVGLSDRTPFFRLWWTVVPFVKSTRAPGMALFVTAFSVATLAAFGVDRVMRGEGERHMRPWLIGGAIVALLGVAGVVGALAESLAGAVQSATGRPAVQAALSGASAIRMGSVVSGLALVAVGGIGWAVTSGRIPRAAGALLVFGVIGADFWSNARPFWNYSRAQDEVFGADPVKTYLASQPRPFRVWNLGFNVVRVPPVYPQSSLMADNIAQWFGHHGNELQSFDRLTGREGIELVYSREGHHRLLELYAINHIIMPVEVVPESIPGFVPVLEDVRTSTGRRAALFERREPFPYARLVPAALKAERDQAIATVLDPRLDFNRIVLIDPDAPIDVVALDALPDPVEGARPRFTRWEPGFMSVELPDEPGRDAFLLISENYYKDWRATADGVPVPVVLGNGALIAVQVPAGTSEVQLQYVSPEFRIGKTLTLVSLLFVGFGLVVPPMLRRRHGG